MRGFSKRIINIYYSLSSKLIFTIPDLFGKNCNSRYFILPFPFQPPGNSCFQVPHSLESPSDVEKNVVQTALNFSHFLYISYTFPISYTFLPLFVRQECFSLLTFVHSLSAPEKNTSSNTCSKRSGRAGLTCCLILSLPFSPCELDAAPGGECSRLMRVAFAMDASL